MFFGIGILDRSGNIEHNLRMNKKIKSSGSVPVKPLLSALLIMLLLLLLAAAVLWQRQVRLTSDIDRLISANAQLQEQLDDARSGPPDRTRSAATAPPEEQEKDPEPEPETLIPQKPSVRKTEAGLAAVFGFESTLQQSPDLLALVVRLPNSSAAKIVGFGAAENSRYTDVRARIDESGKFAIFQGTPADLKALEFELEVSAPVTAVIRGSEGIHPFMVRIDADQPAVSRLED